MKTITNFQGFLVHKYLNFLFFLFKGKINLVLLFLILFYSVTAFSFDDNISSGDVLLVNSIVKENSFLIKGSNNIFSSEITENDFLESKYVSWLFDVNPPLTTIESSQCNSVLDSYLTPIYAVPVARALKYKFMVVDSNNIAYYYESNSNSFLLTDVPNLTLSNNTSYQVSVAVSTTLNVFGDFGASCLITTPPALFTQLVDSQCGGVLSSFGSSINADQVVGATSYKFRVSSGAQMHAGGGPVLYEYVSNSPQFRLTDIPNRTFDFDYTYYISVAVGQNGYYHPYGNVCTIRTPSAVITSVIDSQCGTTLPALDSFITASPVSGASAYKFKIGYMNGMQYHEFYTSPTRQFKLTDLPANWHFTYGRTYEVSVSVSMDNGLFGPYGDTCIITTPTKIQNSQCGVTLSNINDIIYADYVNTTKYKFKIVGNGSIASYVSDSRSFKLSEVVGLNLDYGIAYSISVAVEINSHPYILPDSDGIKWSDFGTVCNIVTPVQVTTKVISSQCGITLPAVNSFITANSVSGASAYKFKIVGGNINTEYVSQTRQFKLTDIPNVTVQYGTNYSISVSAMKNGVYYDYGSACIVSTPQPIYSSILSSQCGASLLAVNSSITANSVSGASSYKFKIVGGNINTEYVSQTRQFKLTDLPNVTILLATNYTISVAANVNGVYHPFGSQCIVTTPLPSIQASQCGITLTNISDDVYANYIVGASEYKFKVIDGSSVYYITNASRVFKLSDVNGLVLQYGKTYQVSVAVNYNNVWTSYGVSCNISTPPPTYAYITSLVCTDNVPVDYVRDDNDYIYATILPGATSYKFLLTVPNGYPFPPTTYLYESSTNKFRLSDVVNLSIKPQSKFGIQVAAKLNGVYNPFNDIGYVYSPTPRIKQSECGKTLSTLNETIMADLVHYGGNYASDYYFRIKKDGVPIGTSYQSNSPSFNLTNVLSNISYDTTYEVFVDATVLGVRYNTQRSCYINTPPTSSIIDSQCGSTLSELNSSITAKSITNATLYKFKVIGSDFTAEYTNSVRSFRLTDIQSQGFTIAYGTTYQVSVSVFVNGVWRDFGTTCNITTPAKYTTLIPSHCGMTIASFGSSITANSVSGATSYKFKVVGENFFAEYISQIRQFRLTDLTNVQILPGTTYQISVAVGQNGLYHPYGTACSITTPPAFYTNIIASQCGTTLSSYNSFITANPVSGATSYKFKVVGGNIDAEYVSQTRQFKLTDIPNAIVTFGTDYSISVSAMKDGIYNPYGDVCIVSTPPLSKIQSSQCGIILTDVSDDIIADFVSDATQYKFRVSDGVSTDKYFVNYIRAFKLTNVIDLDLKYGTSYQVSVSVNINNVWSDFGDICTITTPTLDVFPSIVPSQCGTVLADVNDFIIASSVTDANLYKFKVVGPNLNMEYSSLTNQFKLSDLNQTLSLGAAYQVSVAVNINGAWSSYGSVCTITTPSYITVIDSNLCGSTLDSFDSLITANPLPNVTSYKFKVTSNDYYYFTEEFVSSNNQFRLTDLVNADNFRPGITYLVSVACGVNGSYGDYSSICNITTPKPRIVSPICGSTVTSRNDIITCLRVPGAISYTYKVYSGSSSSNLFYRGSYTNSTNTFRLSDIPNLYFDSNITYSIDISVYTSGSSNGLMFYSEGSCILYSPNFSTSIIASQCGATLQQLSTTIYANPVVDATEYRFEVFSANPFTGVLNVLNTHYTTLNEFKLTDVQNLNLGYNKSYFVKVYAKAYDLWSSVSNGCVVRTPSGSTIVNSDNNMESVNQKTVVDKSKFMISVYPNPFVSSFTLDVVSEIKSNILVNVFDISGRLIETKDVSFEELSSYKFGDSYSAGVYTVTVEQDGNVDTLKVIKP